MKAKIKKVKKETPGAWLVNPKDRGRFSIKNGKCFLKDDSEFEIELFNPLSVSVLAEIKLNGESISKTGLVVRPGQRVYLDCFIDNKKKFKFKTYKVENTEESLKAIERNGLLEVFFYKEEVITLNNWKETLDKIIVERWYPVYPYPYIDYYPYKPYIWHGVGTGGTGAIGTAHSNTLSPDSYNTTASYTAASYTAGYTADSCSNSCSISNDVNKKSLLDTGRVEAGEKSKQEFSEVDMNFQKYYISSTIIQILPNTVEPVEVKTKKIETSKKDDIIRLIKNLSELNLAGILSDDEFSEKKKELLSRL